MSNYRQNIDYMPTGYLGLLILMVMLIMFIGCGHEDLPGQTDSGHIENYILNEELAIDLFRTDNIFPGTPYEWPEDSAIYYDSVLSVDRDFDTYVSDSSWDYGSLGWLFESVSRVSDNFNVRTFQIIGTDTTFTDANRLLVRSAFLLKFGRDSYYYFGWGLHGIGQYNQTSPPITGTLTFPDNSSMRVDYDIYNQTLIDLGGEFRQLSDLKEIPDSTETRIDVNIRNISNKRRYVTIVSYPSDSGYVNKRLDPVDYNNASGTIILQEKPIIAYDFIVFTVFDITTHEFVQSWTIPYRVNPIKVL